MFLRNSRARCRFISDRRSLGQDTLVPDGRVGSLKTTWAIYYTQVYYPLINDAAVRMTCADSHSPTAIAGAFSTLKLAHACPPCQVRAERNRFSLSVTSGTLVRNPSPRFASGAPPQTPSMRQDKIKLQLLLELSAPSTTYSWPHSIGLSPASSSGRLQW